MVKTSFQPGRNLVSLHGWPHPPFVLHPTRLCGQLDHVSLTWRSHILGSGGDFYSNIGLRVGSFSPLMLTL